MVSLEELRQLRDLLNKYWKEYGCDTFYGNEIKVLLQPIERQIERRELEEVEADFKDFEKKPIIKDLEDIDKATLNRSMLRNLWKEPKKKTKIKAIMWKDEIEPLSKSFESLNLIKIIARKNQIPAKVVHYHKMTSMPFIYIHGYFLNEGMNGPPKFPEKTLKYSYRKKIENYTYTCNQCGATQGYDEMIKRFHDSGHNPKELHCTHCGAYDWNEKGVEDSDKNNEKQREAMIMRDKERGVRQN